MASSPQHPALLATTALNSPAKAHKKPVNVPLAAKLVVGGIAGIIGTSIIFPIDMVKTRLQNQASGKAGQLVYNGAWDCFTKIIRSEGVKGLYRGLAPNLVGVTPEKAIKLAVNDEMRRLLENPDGSISLLNEVIAGATAGFCQVRIFKQTRNIFEIYRFLLQEKKCVNRFFAGVDYKSHGNRED